MVIRALTHCVIERYMLSVASNFSFVNQSGCYSIDGVDDSKEFKHTKVKTHQLH